jgi:Putative auto-transporter adhesin, head GIN domain
MKARIGTFLSLLAGLAAGCGLSVVSGSGNIVNEDRDVSGFNAVTLAGSGDLMLTQGETESLTIEADDNLLPHIKSEVRNGTLVIGFDHDNWDTIYRPSQRIKYHLSVKDLNAVTVSGSGDITTASLNADQLALTVSGSGNIRIDQLQANGLTYTLSGSGDADLAGEAGEQNVKISGSGNYRAGDLSSQTVTVGISGSGDATVWAQDSLDVNISGSGSVSYYGQPKTSTNVAGSGHVDSLGDK